MCSTAVATEPKVTDSKNTASSWIGCTSQQVEVVWGKPSSEKPDGTGGRVSTYRGMPLPLPEVQQQSYSISGQVVHSGSSMRKSLPDALDRTRDFHGPNETGDATDDKVVAKFWIDSNDKVYKSWFAKKVRKLGGDRPSVPDPPVSPSSAATGGDEPVAPTDDMVLPVLIFEVEAIYPEVARADRIEGMVLLEAVIDKEGNIGQVRVLSSETTKDVPSNPTMFNDSAIEAVKQRKYLPARKNDRPMTVDVTIRIDFSLDQ